MTITNQEVLKMISKARSTILDEAMESYPEEEREGRCDHQILSDEVGYIVSCFHEDGHWYHDELAEARRLLSKAQYGYYRPIEVHETAPVVRVKIGYQDHNIQYAKDLCNEYNRLKRLSDKLEDMGYYSRW